MYCSFGSQVMTVLVFESIASASVVANLQSGVPLQYSVLVELLLTTLPVKELPGEPCGSASNQRPSISSILANRSPSEHAPSHSKMVFRTKRHVKSIACFLVELEKRLADHFPLTLTLGYSITSFLAVRHVMGKLRRLRSPTFFFTARCSRRYSIESSASRPDALLLKN